MQCIGRKSRFARDTRCLVLAAIVVATFSIAVNGCNRTYISKDSLSKIRSIEIDTDVGVPDSPLVAGPITTTQAFLGYQPSNIGHSFGRYMEAHGVKVDEIVLRAFRRNLTEQGRFELREGGDVTLELAVGTYGFRMPAFYIGNQRKPMLTVSATLRSKDSTVLWQQQESTIFYPNLTTAIYIQTLLESSEFVERSLEEASCVVSYLLLSKLHPMPQPPVVSSVETRDQSPGESQEVLLRIPSCDPVSEPTRIPSERRIKCEPDVGCTYE